MLGNPHQTPTNVRWYVSVCGYGYIAGVCDGVGDGLYSKRNYWISRFSNSTELPLFLQAIPIIYQIPRLLPFRKVIGGGLVGICRRFGT